MSSKQLGRLMRISVIAAAICGLYLCGAAIPSLGEGLISTYPEFASWFWPWLIFAWAVAAPCFIILIYIWKVSGAVTHETVFTMQTAKWVKTGAILMLCDAGFLFIGNFVLLLCHMNHPGMMLLFGVAVIFAVVLALLAAVLSRYLTKAAMLQEESEGTL